jgi:hypothetical protein
MIGRSSLRRQRSALDCRAIEEEEEEERRSNRITDLQFVPLI